MYLKYGEKHGPDICVCELGEIRNKESSNPLESWGPNAPVGSGAPAVLRFQPLSLMRELAQDRVGQSWADVAPLSCKLHPSLHSRKGVELWNALSHLSLVLAEPGVSLPGFLQAAPSPRQRLERSLML